VGEGCDPTVIPSLRTAAMLCGKSGPGLYTWSVRKPWWSNPRHRLTPVARCFTGLSLPHPPKTPVTTDLLNYYICENTFLYITTGSFGSGGEGKVFISASGAMVKGCDPTVIPSLRTAAMLCGDQVLVCTPGRCRTRGGPTPITD